MQPCARQAYTCAPSTCCACSHAVNRKRCVACAGAESGAAAARCARHPWGGGLIAVHPHHACQALAL